MKRVLLIGIVSSLGGLLTLYGLAEIPEFTKIQRSSTNSSQIEITLSNLSTTDTYTFATSTNLISGVAIDNTLQQGSVTTITVRFSATNAAYFLSRISTSEDFDGDSLPNGWEVQNSLSPTNTAGSNGSSGDPDSDGVNNLTEYLQGRNPQEGAIADSNLVTDLTLYTLMEF